MTDSVGSGIELSERPHEHPTRQQTFVSLPTPDEKKSDEHAAGKLPPEAPPPVAPFQLHVQSLKNLVSSGLDMKNQADYDALVHPLMNRCGGSIEKLASMIDAPLSGGLKDIEGAEKRREAFGANRLPEKELVCAPPHSVYFCNILLTHVSLPSSTMFLLQFERYCSTDTPLRLVSGSSA